MMMQLQERGRLRREVMKGRGKRGKPEPLRKKDKTRAVK